MDEQRVTQAVLRSQSAVTQLRSLCLRNAEVRSRGVADDGLTNTVAKAGVDLDPLPPRCTLIGP